MPCRFRIALALLVAAPGRADEYSVEMRTPILVSAATAARLTADIRLGRRAVLAVKGRELPVEVVEVLAAAPPVA